MAIEDKIESVRVRGIRANGWGLGTQLNITTPFKALVDDVILLPSH